jgi:hypothetical protein
MATDKDLEEVFINEEPINISTIENDDGSVEIEFIDPEEDALDGIETEYHYENLSPYLDEEDRLELAAQVEEGYDQDEDSRHEHLKNLVRGIENMGLSDQNVETPFEGGATVTHPLIMENSVKIQAKAEGELLPANGPVKSQILGDNTDEDRQKQATRIKKHMNWQLTEQMPEFYTNTQKGLLQTALFGDSFKKNYYDFIKGRVCDTLIPVDRLVVNSCYENLENAPRITEIQYISEREMKARMYSGQYWENVDLPEAYKLEKTDIGRKIDELLGLRGTGEGYELLEQHVYLDLPGFEDESGVPLPYIVTIEKVSGEVLAIRRNWEENGNVFEKREWFTQYPFVPGFGFYNLGYIHLLGNFQMTLTAIMRSLVDSGSFANMQGGFKSKAMRVLDDGEAIAPGEWRDVEFYGPDISKGIYPFNFKESSLIAQNK